MLPTHTFLPQAQGGLLPEQALLEQQHIADGCLLEGGQSAGSVVALLESRLLRRRFRPGPFYTGKVPSLIINTVAVLYVLFITAVFILPTGYPTTSTTLNWCACPGWLAPGWAGQGLQGGALSMQGCEAARHPAGAMETHVCPAAQHPAAWCRFCQ